MVRSSIEYVLEPSSRVESGDGVEEGEMLKREKLEEERLGMKRSL